MMVETKEWIVVCAAEDISVGEALGFEHEGMSIAVFRVADELFYSTDDICSHGYALLSQGYFEDCMIECPLHGGQFDIRTGKGLCDPIEKDIATYPVRLRDGNVLIGIPGPTEV